MGMQHLKCMNGRLDNMVGLGEDDILGVLTDSTAVGLRGEVRRPLACRSAYCVRWCGSLRDSAELWSSQPPVSDADSCKGYIYHGNHRTHHNAETAGPAD